MDSFFSQGLTLLFLLISTFTSVVFVARYKFWKDQSLLLAFFFPVSIIFASGLMCAMIFDLAPYFTLLKVTQSVLLFSMTVLLSLVVRWFLGERQPQLLRLAWRFPLLSFLIGWAVPLNVVIGTSFFILMCLFLILFNCRKNSGQLWRTFIKFSLMYLFAMTIYLAQLMWWQLPLLFSFVYLIQFFHQFCAAIYLKGLKVI